MFDRFDRRIDYLRVSVTDLCNLRCRYCMPEEGVRRLGHEAILSFEEIHEVVRSACALGIRKVRLTGGEPLVRRGVVGLVRMLGALPIDDFAMTTNAVLLPRFATELKAAGLMRLNISLDTLDPGRFAALTRVGRLEDVLAGIDAAAAAGFAPLKLNCVIQESPDEPDARAVADFGRARGFEVRFIRQMDTRQGHFWPVQGGEGGRCATCNRLRLSSDGRIYPCLFSDLSFSVRELGVASALEAAVQAKPGCGEASDNRFYRLGG